MKKERPEETPDGGQERPERQPKTPDISPEEMRALRVTEKERHLARRRSFASHAEYARDTRATLEQTGELFLQLAGKMKQDVEDGMYVHIIGDDASGRIPALMLGHFLSAVYRERGREAPGTTFVGGSRFWEPSEEQKEELKRLLQVQVLKGSLRDELARGKKFVIATDFVATGAALAPLVKILEELGIRFDVMALGVESDEVQERLRRAWPNMDRLHFAAEGRLPRIWGRSDISGISKVPGSLRGTPLTEALPEHSAREVRGNIAVAREFVRDIAARAEREYRKE